MDRTTTGLGSTEIGLPAGFDPSLRGPIDRPTAIALLARADDLLDENEPDQALAYYARAIGFPDRDVTAAAYFGAGNALYRLDRDDEALQAWEQATQLGETPVAYRAWRQVAAARVRGGDLRGAVDAYRQCERRAPREDRAEIASRLGWLNKETGNTRAAGRYFARSRGDLMAPFLTYLVIAATVVISMAASGTGQASFQLMQSLELDKSAVAEGEYWRLFTVTLVHGGVLHLFFNMYALYFAGVVVERMYGWLGFAFFYVLGAIAASTASYVFGSAQLAVGASGAIFCLFGVLFASFRAHSPVVDRQSRQIAGQLGALIVVNLAFGFLVPNIDNTAHIGGLLAGLWLGYLIPPGRVPTLASLWHRSGGARATSLSLVAARVLGVLALIAVVVAGLAIGPQRLF